MTKAGGIPDSAPAGERVFFVFDDSTLVTADWTENQGLHAHRHWEMLVAVDQPLLVKQGARGEFRETRAAIFSPLEPHAVTGSAGPIAHLYVEPGIRRLACWNKARATLSDEIVDGVRDKVRALLDVGRAEDHARALAAWWRLACLPNERDVPLIDRRIANALQRLTDLPLFSGDRAGLAAHVQLSQSRFAALFALEMQMPLSQYIIWRRIMLGARYVALGLSVAEAAERSGFSDTAHFCRHYRKTFGVRPSRLRKIRIGGDLTTPWLEHRTLKPTRILR